MTGVRLFLLVLAVAALAPRDAHASSAAGFEIEVGKFKLQMFYSVAIDYPDHADVAIRDPRLALFTVASALQQNGDAFAAIDHTVRVELNMAGESPAILLDVIEDPEADRASTSIVRQGPFTGDAASEVLAILCSRYQGACRRPATASLMLYRCRESDCHGRIRFGSFPSESLNQGFALLPPKRGGVPIRVVREQMTRYFGVLD
jgi:hypothetical protein